MKGAKYGKNEFPLKLKNNSKIRIILLLFRTHNSDIL